MPKPDRTSDDTATTFERRTSHRVGRPFVAGVPVRDTDIEPTRGLHSVAALFRILAGLLVVIILLQVINGLTSPDRSYGVLLADVIRLVIFAGLLWGAGDLADLFVKSHYDLRAARILLGRLASHAGASSTYNGPDPGDDANGAGNGEPNR